MTTDHVRVPGFVFRPSAAARLVGLLLAAGMGAVTVYAIVLAVRNSPPVDRLAAGIAMIFAFDALAFGSAGLVWRSFVVYDEAGLVFRNLLREQRLVYE